MPCSEITSAWSARSPRVRERAPDDGNVTHRDRETRQGADDTVEQISGAPRAIAAIAVVAFLLLPGGLSAGPALQAAAPGSLRCPGRTLPEPPERWRWEWAWEVLDTYQFPGSVASDDGPYAVALDRVCNLYVADAEHNQVVKLS